MHIDEASFFETLREGSIYEKLGDSLLPFLPGERAGGKEALLQQLFRDIRSSHYFPSVPRGYVIADKHNYVPRIAPVLSDRDGCVFYYCIKQLQEVIAVNRVDGTFGGWTMGNPIRDQEVREFNEDLEHNENYGQEDDPIGPYYSVSSFSPAKWTENWVSFQRVALEKSRREEFGAFIKLDIANYYDSVRLDVLERKIRIASDARLGPVVDLLFVLLRFWNRQFEDFLPKSVGIPQEEIGDGSRLLANFYLQDYDTRVTSVCHEIKGPAQYLRYADDQIIMAPNLFDARLVLVDAARALHRIGLNINSGKVLEFVSREDYDHFWCFELFALLEDKEDVESINEAARTFMGQIHADRFSPNPRPWRSGSVLKRLVSLGLDRIEEPTRTEIVGYLLEEHSVVKLQEWMLKKIAPALTTGEREQLFSILDKWIRLTPFSSYLLNVRRFYLRKMIGQSTEEIDLRLEELKLF